MPTIQQRSTHPLPRRKPASGGLTTTRSGDNPIEGLSHPSSTLADSGGVVVAPHHDYEVIDTRRYNTPSSLLSTKNLLPKKIKNNAASAKEMRLKEKKRNNLNGDLNDASFDDEDDNDDILAATVSLAVVPQRVVAVAGAAATCTTSNTGDDASSNRSSSTTSSSTSDGGLSICPCDSHSSSENEQDEKHCVIVTISNTELSGVSDVIAPLSTPECPTLKSSCSSSTNSQSDKSITSSSSTDGAAAPTPLIVGPPTLSHQLRQLPFRTDLDETQQRHIMKTIVAQHHAQWLSEQQRSKTNSDISGWSKSQQAIVLCHLVAEAHRYQVKLKDQRHVELLPASSLPATPPPAAANRRRKHAQKDLDFSDPKIAALLLADIVMLVAEDVPSRYTDLRQQLVSLNLWL